MAEQVSDLSGPTPYIKTPSSAAVTVTDYTVGATGLVTPSTVLPAGAYLSADLELLPPRPLRERQPAEHAHRAVDVVGVKSAC
jgi:hypothetical protein